MTRERIVGQVLPCCVVCGEVPRGGIADGIFVRKRFICVECEARLAEMRLERDEYERLRKHLRGVCQV